MSHLGPHIQTVTDAGLAWARVAPVVKALDVTTALQVARPDAYKLFRCYFPYQNLQVKPTDVAGPILAALQGYRDERLYCEVYNEIGKAGRDQYIRLLQGVVPILHAAGVKVAGPSWATGDFEAADWLAFRAAGWAGIDAVAVHGYWGLPSIPGNPRLALTSYNALRYRTYWRPGQGDPRLLFITEVGRDRCRDGDPKVDDGYVGQGGWKRDGVQAGVYLDELEALDTEIRRDGEVYAVAFTSGPRPEWEPYSTDGLDVSRFAVAAGVAPAPVPSPHPPGGQGVTLRVALIPSNQANLFQGADGKTTSERTQMLGLAKHLEAALGQYRAVEAETFASSLETDTKGLPQLRAQIGQAVAWLDQAPAGTLTLALHLHSDSGKVSHVGAYWGDQDVTHRLALALRGILARCLYTNVLLGENYERQGYLAWTLSPGKHAPVILEVGSHQVAEDVRRVAEGGAKIAEALAGEFVSFFGVSAEKRPTTVPLNAGELGVYAQWSLARLANNQTPLDLAAFSAHLKALGCPDDRRRYGCPT